jgi:hypothetical protein
LNFFKINELIMGVNKFPVEDSKILPGIGIKSCFRLDLLKTLHGAVLLIYPGPVSPWNRGRREQAPCEALWTRRKALFLRGKWASAGLMFT